MKKREKAFGEIKNYYNDITHNNLDLIRSLKDEVSDMKKKEISNEKLMFEIAQENKKLSEPCLLYTSPSPRDATLSRMPSSA